MRESHYGDVFKVLLWVFCSLLIALALTPITYNAGKAMAELSDTKDFGGMANWFANWSRRAEMENFFRISLGLSALLLLLPLIEWLRLGKRVLSGSFHLTNSAGAGTHIRPNALHALTGFFVSFGILIVIAAIMLKTGSLAWSNGAEPWHKDLWVKMVWACFVALFMETIFRSFMMGIFSRAVNMYLAILLAALIFGGVFFLLSGFPHTRIYDTETISPVKLAWILFMEGDLLRRAGLVFLPWFAFGCVLGWARWRTASILLPSGLLAGYFLALCLVENATQSAVTSSGATCNAGLPAIIGVLFIGILVHYFTKPNTHPSGDEHGS